MDKRGVLAAAVAVELVAGGGAAVARLPREAGTATVEQAAFAPGDAALPVPTLSAPLPTAVPTAVPTGVPTLPPITLPPLPSISLPPLPTVSLPPLPTVSLPAPLCPADLGATELPRHAQSVDLRGEGGSLRGPVSGAGRIWFGVMDGPAPPHLTGVDPATGSRLAIPTGVATHVFDVSGGLVWAVADMRAVVTYDAATGAEAHRWDRTNTAHDGAELHLYAARGDGAGGGWLLGSGDGEDGAFVAVVRVGKDGAPVWSTRLPGPYPNGYVTGRGEYLAVRDGSLYVGMSGVRQDRAAFWRVAPDGSVAAHRELGPRSSTMANMRIAAGPSGVYALASSEAAGGVGFDTRLLRLDPDDLRVLATARVDWASDLFLGAGAVWASGQDCSFDLARLDPVTLRRTGFWRTDRAGEGTEGTVHGGDVWMLYAPEAVPVALHRYDLP
ncbi:MAG TPA: hypothetical protein VGX28_08440 [Frankiaceae bacterium]|jgi:hypothetical protein|nr:hypothetical protein [Frankiaceae bacterium]